MAAVPSTARLNRRYLLVRASKSSVEAALMEYLGVLGWSKAAPVFLSGGSGELILSVNREELHHVQAACALYKEIIPVAKVSGTLKGLGVKLGKR